MSTGESDRVWEGQDRSNHERREGLDRESAGRPSESGISDRKNASVSSEIMSQLRFHLHNAWATMLLRAPESPKTLLLCGANYGEGTSFLSYHLALLLCLEYDLKTLYVETDPGGQKPYSTLSAAEERHGLAAYFNDHRPLTSLVQETETAGFYLLPDAPRFDVAGMSRFLSEKEAIGQLVSYCADHFDVTIFDGQPVHKSPRVIGFARAVDQVVFVCRYAVSRREVSRLALEKLRQGGVNILGVILNDRQYPVPARIYKSLK